VAQWLQIIAKNHKEWIRIVESFGERNYAEDIVQEMYLVLYKYADPNKIITNGKANKGYIYFTLRSTYYQYYNAKHKITKTNIDNYKIKYIDNLEEQKAYNNICQLIDKEIEDWHWYDKKLFKLYRDTDMSIRKLAKETGISWVSIFNTLKNCKNKIKDKYQKDWDKYKKL
jgi:RNA polymerase sigma factor (sigma-70 family)